METPQDRARDRRWWWRRVLSPGAFALLIAGMVAWHLLPLWGLLGVGLWVLVFGWAVVVAWVAEQCGGDASWRRTSGSWRWSLTYDGRGHLVVMK